MYLSELSEYNKIKHQKGRHFLFNAWELLGLTLMKLSERYCVNFKKKEEWRNDKNLMIKVKSSCFSSKLFPGKILCYNQRANVNISLSKCFVFQTTTWGHCLECVLIGSPIKDRQLVKCYFLQARGMVGNSLLEARLSAPATIMEAVGPLVFYWRTGFEKRITCMGATFSHQH